MLHVKLFEPHFPVVIVCPHCLRVVVPPFFQVPPGLGVKPGLILAGTFVGFFFRFVVPVNEATISSNALMVLSVTAAASSLT